MNSVSPKKWGVKLRGTLLGFLAVFVFLEILLRVFPFARLRLEPQYFFQADSVLGWRMTPNAHVIFQTTEFKANVDTNSDGFRDKEYTPEHQSFRIAGLGGSYPFAYGLPPKKSYLKILEKKFNEEHPAKPVEVINMSVPSYSIRQSTVLFEEKGLKYKPQLVLASLAITDPINVIQHEYSIYDGYLIRTDALRSPFLKYKFAVYKYFKSIHFFAKTADRIRQRLTERFVEKQPGYVSEQKEEYQKGLAIIEEYLRRLHQICRQNHAELAVAYMPHRSQVHPGQYQAGPYAVYLDLDTKLEEICRKEGIHYIRLLPGLLKAAQAGEKLHFNVDGHWSAKGHERAAEIIFEDLKKWGVVK